MTKSGEKTEGTTSADPLSAVARHARRAMDSAKEAVAEVDFDALKEKTADAASAFVREGREFLDRDEVVSARDQLSDHIRKNPLAAVGVAFAAGLLVALLTRG